MIYTSFYGNKNIPSSMTKVSISRYPPTSWKGAILKELAPSEQLFYNLRHKIITPSQFCDLFIQEINTPTFMSLLQALMDYPSDIVLLCYEKPTQFCHRQLISKLAKQYNIIIKELD